MEGEELVFREIELQKGAKVGKSSWIYYCDAVSREVEAGDVTGNLIGNKAEREEEVAAAAVGVGDVTGAGRWAAY